MEVETIATALLVIGAFALFLVLLRRLPPTEEDLAVVVAAIVRTPAEFGRPPGDHEGPVRWRLDLLRPRAADASLYRGHGDRLAKPDRVVLSSDYPPDPARKSRMDRPTAAGSSHQGMWPAPSTICTSPFES